jgi:hypothetical protein
MLSSILSTKNDKAAALKGGVLIKKKVAIFSFGSCGTDFRKSIKEYSTVGLVGD